MHKTEQQAVDDFLLLNFVFSYSNRKGKAFWDTVSQSVGSGK